MIWPYYSIKEYPIKSYLKFAENYPLLTLIRYISGLLFFERDIYHLIENALCALKADLQGKFCKLRDIFH